MKQREDVATESSPVEVQAMDCDTDVLDQHAVDNGISDVDTSKSRDATAISGTVAASSQPDSQSSDTVAKRSTVTVIGHVIPHVSRAAQLSESRQQEVVCIDSDVSASLTDTAAVTDETLPSNLTPSSPVIDIIDDDDAVGDIADEAESSISERMKETVANAWQGRNGSAMKSVVKKALEHVSTLQGTNSPLSANSNVSPTVTATSYAAVTSAKDSATPQTMCTATSTVRSCRGTVRGITTAASQSDVPTARVIGHIVHMRQSSPQVTSAPHRAVTTVTQSTAVSVSPQVTVTTAVHPVPPQATVTAAVHPVNPPVTVTQTVHPTPISTTAARANSSNMSSVAKNHGSTPSRSASSGRSRPPVRRRPQSRRVAVLRPEDLYEISSQIVAQVLQHNKQTDIITCDDDDDEDDEEGVSESHSSTDVVVIDAPASGRQATSARHPRPQQKSSSATAAGTGARTPSGKRLLIPPSMHSSSSKPSHRGQGPSKASDDVTVIDDECRVTEDSDDVVCCDEDDTAADNTPERTSTNPVPTNRIPTAAAAVAIDDDSNDVICYDEDVHNSAADDRLERTPANPVPTNRASASAAVDDDDVLICDTPAPSETRPNPSNTRYRVGQSDSVMDTSIGNVTASHTRTHRRDDPATSTTVAANHMSCTATSVFAALLCPEDSAADDLILVEPDSPTALSVTASHNRTHRRDGPVPSSTVTANRPPCSATSTSAAVPHQEVRATDEVVLVEPDNSTASSETATVNARCSSSPLIILD